MHPPWRLFDTVQPNQINALFRPTCRLNNLFILIIYEWRGCYLLLKPQTGVVQQLAAAYLQELFRWGPGSRPLLPACARPSFFTPSWCTSNTALSGIPCLPRGLRRRILCPSQPFLYSLDCFLIGGMFNSYSGYVLKMLGVQSDAYMHSFPRI